MMQHGGRQRWLIVQASIPALHPGEEHDIKLLAYVKSLSKGAKP